MKLQKSFEKQLSEFKDAWQTMRNDLARLGHILVDMLDANENAMEIILQQCPGATVEGLEMLERIGRDDLDARLAANASPAAQLAITRHLPMAAQRQLIEQTVPVAVEGKSGITVVNKRLSEIKDAIVANQFRERIIFQESTTNAE